MDSSGINKWIAGIRYRMENDPGRQDLDDHILCNGFLFLDEYLEDILTGTRTEPIIELTKTPGRRKDASKKVRSAATVKMVSLELGSLSKENVPIVTSPTTKKAPTAFQKALLKASKENQPPDHNDRTTPIHNSPRPESRSPFGPAIQLRDTDAQEEEVVKALVTLPLARVTSAPLSEGAAQPLLPPLTFKQPTVPPDVSASADVNNPGLELSIIPEGDDEREPSRASPQSPQKGLIIRDKEILYPVPKDPSDPDGPTATVAVSYNPADDDDDTQAFQTPFDRSFNDSEPTSTASSFPIDPYARDYETHELRYMMGTEQTLDQAPPSSPPTQNLVRKASVPVFPSLPGPSPLRKSTHEPAGSGPILNNLRSSVATGTATRTSWLNKARDVTAKRTSVISGVKRKSGELSGDPSSINFDEDHIRASKVSKMSGDTDGERLQSKMSIQPFRPVVSSKAREEPIVRAAPAVTADGNSEGMMNILKRTVEGLGARVGKSMGKSLGGTAAAAAAAEAKAAAEARLAKREAKGSDESRQGRLSVSDLISVYDNGKGKDNDPSPVISSVEPSTYPAQVAVSETRTSISTTPPDSPQVIRQSPLLVPNAPATTMNIIPKFTVQHPMLPEPSFTMQESQPSTQSTHMSSIFDDHSAWPPSSQTTDFTASQGFSQPEVFAKDSALAQNHGDSTLPKEVGWGHNQPDPLAVQYQFNQATLENWESAGRNQAGAQDASHSQKPEAVQPADEEVVLVDEALLGADIENEEETGDAMGRSLSTPPSNIGMTKSKDGSSQPSSQTGFVAQASGLLSKVMGSSVGSALGGSKRGKAEPLKSIQLAAAAAKKQQEEADRKAARLREMDKRRAAIASKKAVQETAGKGKQQGERRKRERDEGPEKKVTRAAAQKVEEDVVKKRKVVVEIEKPESKRPKEKTDVGGSRIGKPVSAVSQIQPGQSTSSRSFKQPGAPAAPQSTVKLVGSSQGEAKSTAGLPKSTKDKLAPDTMEDVRQPSQTLHAQMQARVEAQLLQARLEEPTIPSESIELPDINSEYSNSDDEDRPRTFDPPGWAQSPDLRLALESQSRMNPDDIFGPVRPLRMEEIFPTRQSRFRARTSSANWAGTDEVTRAEEAQYAKRMGYLD